MKYGNLTLGQVEAIINKLGGEEAAKRFLRDELELVKSIPELKVWKTVRIGLYKGCKEYIEAINSAFRREQFFADEWGEALIEQISYSTEVTELDLVLCSASDLGIKRAATYSKICAGAKSLGLELCPAEVGPALRLEYVDQPRGFDVMIGMKPVPIKTQSGSSHEIFWLEYDYDSSDHYLCGHLVRQMGASEQHQHPDVHFVFVKPRK